MKRFCALLLLPIIFFLNSSGVQTTTDQRKYGGVLRVNLSEDFRSLFPPSIIEQQAKDIAGQVYEGLVKCDPQTLKIVPSLASSWEVNKSYDKFTFHLRTNAYFHDGECFATGKGRKLVAQDVKSCFTFLCRESVFNYAYANTFKGLVANEDAFRVINDSTFSIHTSAPCTYLLSILTQPACWIYPHEAFEKYSDGMRVHCVGTGPFRVRTIKEGEVVILERNTSYWRKDAEGNQLPYLGAIKFTFIKDKHTALAAMKTFEIDLMTNLDMNDIIPLLQDSVVGFRLYSDTSLSLTFYGFLHTKPPFNNLKVRQAFCYAIDKQRIADKILMGDVIPAGPGFIPRGIPGYTNANADYKFDVAKARQLLKEAGYPNGVGFPEMTLQVNNGGGERNMKVAEYIVYALKENLGITLTIEAKPFAQHLESFMNGRADFYRTGWIIDYPDPRPFLELAYGKNVPADAHAPSSINSTRFKNPAFDLAFEKAGKEPDEKMRMNYYRQAENIAMENAFILPLYYEMKDELLPARFKNYFVNGLSIRDFSEVWVEK